MRHGKLSAFVWLWNDDDLAGDDFLSMFTPRSTAKDPFPPAYETQCLLKLLVVALNTGQARSILPQAGTYLQCALLSLLDKVCMRPRCRAAHT